MFKPILLAGILCGLMGMGMVQNAQGQVHEWYPFHKYTQNDGLSSYNITRILQDRYGFIWVGTQDGLNCFDGRKFLVFGKEIGSGRRLHGNNVMDMMEDRTRGCIWLTTAYGGLDRIDTRRQVTDPLRGQDAKNLAFKDQWIHALCLHDNILWIGTSAGCHAYDLDTHQFHPIDSRFINPDTMRVGKLLRDSSGMVWACCDEQGIFLFDGATGRAIQWLSASQLNLSGSGKPLTFWNVNACGSGYITAATSWGLRTVRLSPSGQLLVDSVMDRSFYKDETFSCAVDQNKNLWFSDAHSLYRFDAGRRNLSRITESTTNNDSWQTSVLSLFIDRDNRVWLGSEEGLAYFLPAKPAFEKFYTAYRSDIKIQHAYSLYPESDSILYCGAVNGLYRVNTREHLIQQLHKAGSTYLISPLSSGSSLNGRSLLVSNSEGTFILRDHTLRRAGDLYPELKPLESDLLCSLVRFNDSIVVLGSEVRKGLYIWEMRRHRLQAYTSSNSSLFLQDGVLNGLYKDRKGKLWVLSSYSLSAFDPLTHSAVNFHLRLPGSLQNCGVLTDICETRDSYWLTAYGMGLVETDKSMKVRRIISEKDGLCNNGVYKVFSSGDSLVLITSNNGFSILNPSTRRIRNYFESDGLQSNSFEQFCGYSGRDKIYAGGLNGFTIIDPGNFSINKSPPKLYFTGVQMATRVGFRDTTDLGLSSLSIPNDVYQTTISFTGVNFSNPQRTTYSYRIKELNTDWTNLGTQNFINLIGINPGGYTLQVRGANEDGVEASEPLNIRLTFLPKWYQTNWFKIGILVAIIAFFYGLYRYRLAQIKKQQQIRREIANDLHDDLGSTLNTVKVMTHVAKREANKDEYLDHIEASLATAAAGLRDMIWVLDDSRDTVREFIERVKKLGLPVTAAHGIHLECSVAHGLEEHALTKSEKRDLLLIVKESLNNCIKYADCHTIRVIISNVAGKLSLTIHDDGIGFDTSLPPEGNGLNNIRYRAEQIHYRVAITALPGQGTHIELTKK